MNQYLLSTYAVDGEVLGAPNTPEEMQAFMERVTTLEAEMDANGSFVFSGGLQIHDSKPVTVAHKQDGELLLVDSPFVESKTQIAGFYIINADNLDAALAWARKVADATKHSIEVRPFQATGRMKDYFQSAH